MTNKLNLMLHCGSNAATREQIEAIETPKAEGIWHPIAHDYLISELHKRLPNFGMTVVAEAYGLFYNKKQGTEGDRMFGLMQVEPTFSILDDDDKHDDYSLVFGVRNSHDKAFAAGVCCGLSVFVCDNLSFSGEITLARRHTTNIMNDLPNIINSAVANLVDMRHTQATRIEAYKETELTNNHAKALILDGFTAGAINSTRIVKVLAEWNEPRHDEFKPRNVWSLFNGVTEVLKDSSLVELPNRTTRLHALLDNACGLVIDAKAAVKKDLDGMDDLDIR